MERVVFWVVACLAVGVCVEASAACDEARVAELTALARSGRWEQILVVTESDVRCDKIETIRRRATAEVCHLETFLRMRNAYKRRDYATVLLLGVERPVPEDSVYAARAAKVVRKARRRHARVVLRRARRLDPARAEVALVFALEFDPDNRRLKKALDRQRARRSRQMAGSTTDRPLVDESELLPAALSRTSDERSLDELRRPTVGEAKPATVSLQPYLRAERAMDAGDDDRATQLLTEVTRAQPRFAPAWWSLGVVHDKHGRAADAAVAFARFLELDPSDPKAPQAWSWLETHAPNELPEPDKLASAVLREAAAAQAAGNHERARARLTWAKSIAPELPAVWLQVGLFHEDAGESSAAVAAYERYLELDGSGPHAERVKRVLKSEKLRRN